jgi:hypothetical protein
MRLQALYPIQFCKLSIKRTERQMSRLARDLQYQAIRKSQRRSIAVFIDCHCYDVRILYRQILVVEQHFNRQGNLLCGAIIDGIEHPHRFDQNQMGYPCALGDEFFCCSYLTGIVSNNKPDEDIRVNGEHGACESPYEWHPLRSEDSFLVPFPQTKLDANR